MSDIGNTLKTKFGPLPVWAWTLLGTIALALWLIRQKSKNASTTQAAADQTNSDLGSAAELANMFEVAGLMPYQGGDVYVNTTQTTSPPPKVTLPSPTKNKVPVGKDIETARFYKVTKDTDWNTLAKQLGVFGGNGQALYQYNLIPNKHTAATRKGFMRTPKTVSKGNLIAVPMSGVYITLPYVGTVKS
jgi:hypothetical protein